MSVEAFIDQCSQEEWGKSAKDFADYSIYQTCAYQQVRANNDGQEVKRMIVKDKNGEVVLMCHLRIKNIKPFGIKIGYVQSGPLMLRENNDLDCLRDALIQLRDLCLNTGLNVLRIVPNLRDDEVGGEIRSLLELSGFKKNLGVAPYRTFMVPLSDSEEEIRSRIHRESQRILRKAEKMQIEIREGTDLGFFETLENLYTGAKERKGFKGLDSTEFVKTQQMLAQNNKAIVLVAYYNGQPVTAHATTHFGNTAVPILTASNETGLRYGASYLLWWKAYIMAKKKGMKYYDLGGVDPVKNPKGYLFKKRMGGEETCYIGGFEVCANFLVTSMWHIVEKCYRLSLKHT